MSQLKRKLKHLASTLVYRLMMTGLPSSRANGKMTDIAAVCLAALGDFIVFCSVARELHERGKRLVLICRKDTGIEEFAAMTGFFEAVIPLSHQFCKRPANIRRLKRVRVHTVLVAPVERHILSDLYALAITADCRILPDTMQGCSLPVLKRAVDRRADLLVPVTERNEQRRYEQYLRGSGLCNSTIVPFVLQQNISEKGPGKRCIAVFPGAGGGRAKQWPVERFAYVASVLRREYGCEVLACGAKEERALGDRLCGLLGEGAENLCGRTDIATLAHWLQKCALVLANDSGSAHLAIAFDVPTVIVGGGWEYGRFYPNPRLPANCRAVVPQVDTLRCAPCGKSQPDCVERKAAPCLLTVEQKAVLEAARCCIALR